MKLTTTLLILAAAVGLSACGKQTAEQKITRQIEDRIHALMKGSEINHPGI